MKNSRSALSPSVHRLLKYACVLLPATLAATPEAHASGLYGTVLYGYDGIVEYPTVYIQKFNFPTLTWLPYSTTSASICGYYTFDVSESGTYRACVDGTYDLRYGDENSCTTEFQSNEYVTGCSSSAAVGSSDWNERHICVTGSC